MLETLHDYVELGDELGRDRESNQEKIRQQIQKLELETYSLQHIQEICDGIKEGVRLIGIDSGLNLESAEVTELPEGIAGEYNTKTQITAIDKTFLTEASSETIAHVIVHEGKHYADDYYADAQIQDIDAVEALTELSTQRITGEVQAYQDEINQLRSDIHNNTEKTLNDVVNLFERHQNEEINQIMQEARGEADRYESAIAA